MRKLIGLVKLGGAALFNIAILFAIVSNFDADELGITLFVSFAALVISVVYCFYLVPTGLRDLRSASSPLRWWILPGLVLCMVSCAASIYYAMDDLVLYGRTIPFAVIGLLISIRDMVDYKRSRSIKSAEGTHAEPLADPKGKVTFTVQLDRKEWVRFVLRKAYDTPVVIWMTFIGIMFAVTAVAMLFMDMEVPLASVLFAIFFGAAALIVVPFLTWKQAVRQFREEVWVRDPVRYEVTGTGLHITAPGTEVRIERGSVVVEEFRGWLIIKTGQQTGLYIPPRTLDGLQQSEIKAIVTGLRS